VLNDCFATKQDSKIKYFIETLFQTGIAPYPKLLITLRIELKYQRVRHTAG
jgi:hypothetical protein